MKEDEFINNPNWVIVVFPTSNHQIQHISGMSDTKTLCGRACMHTTIYDLYSRGHLCSICEKTYLQIKDQQLGKKVKK